MRRKVRNKEELRVRRLLDETGLTAVMVAEKLGVTKEAIYGRMKRGYVDEIIDTIKKIDKELEAANKVA